MDQTKKQQNTKRIPPTKQTSSQKIRHNRNGKPKHTRNVSTKKWAPKLQKIGLYKLQTMIKYKSQWYGKKFTQADPFPIQPTMQQLRIQKTRPNTKN